jgi:hypothetical protein
MPKFIDVHKRERDAKLKFDEERVNALNSFITVELEDAVSSRHSLESVWRQVLRMYEGVPKNPVKNFPIENAPNIEITLGAIASDAIYAQAYDTIFGIEPFVTVRAVPKSKGDKEYHESVKALQRFVNFITDNELGIKESGDEFILDDVQLGTGVLYIPWTERRKKTKVAKILAAHPKIRCMPPEDVFAPGGSVDDPDEAIWIGLRFWYTAQEVEALARRNKWNTLGIAPAGAKDWVRTHRELLGKQYSGIERKGNLYEIFDIYAYFDIDGDGLDEDLYIVWDRTSRTILHVGYNPYDKRPIEKGVYQRRSHLFYGLGVLEMMMPYEDELTDIHNWGSLNILLANARIWKARSGNVPSNMSLWPNKVIELSNPKEDLMPEQMGEVYPSIWQAQSVVMQLAERRVGVNEMSQPQGKGSMGTRTPGITALTMLQQTNKRFTPAFGSMRKALSNAVKQALYRYQERVLAGRTKVLSHIVRVLGVEDGYRVINILRNEDFDEGVVVELTASSASTNKEAERQATFQLVQILSQYYQRAMELTMVAANPQAPPAVTEVAKQIAESMGEVIERTLRTFDQVRDPSLFTIEMEEAIEEATADRPRQLLLQLMQGMQGAGGGGEAGGIEQPAQGMIGE